MGPFKLQSDRTRKYLAVATVAVTLLIPFAAFAIPGSGSFISGESASGQDLTYLYNTIAKICVGILIVVEGVLFYAIFKFRRQSEDEQPEPVHGNLPLEVTWTLAALAIQIYIGWASVEVMFDVETEPQQGSQLVVEAVASQWDWKFRYPKQQFKGRELGGFTTDDLVIPAHARVELDVTSNDVLHAIFIPKLGVKIDAVPGRYNYWWFSASGPTPADLEGGPREPSDDEGAYTTTRSGWPDFLMPDFDPNGAYTADGTHRVDFLGRRQNEEGEWQKIPTDPSPYAEYEAREYVGLCAELCGKGHWNMYFRTVAMTHTSFFEWLEDRKSGGDVSVDGGGLYSKHCQQCHGADGAGTGNQFPPLNGSRWTEELGDGDDITKEDHIEVVLMGSNAESLEGPTKVKGTTYSGAQMQPVGKQNNLYDEQVAALVNHERNSWGNSGENVTAETVATVREELGMDPNPMPKPGEVEPTKLVEEGKPLYQACAGCHGDDGRGPDTVPNLEGNQAVIGGDLRGLVETAVSRIDGDEWPGVHTPAARDMSDREIAALLTYIRQAWDNDASAVQPKEVGEILEEVGRNPGPR